MTLKLSKAVAFCFSFFIFLFMLSVSYFSGSSLDSQLNMTDGVRFVIPSTLILSAWFVFLLFFLVFKGSVKYNLAFSGVFYFFFVIVIYKILYSLLYHKVSVLGVKAAFFFGLFSVSMVLTYLMVGRNLYLSSYTRALLLFALSGSIIGFFSKGISRN